MRCQAGLRPLPVELLLDSPGGPWRWFRAWWDGLGYRDSKLDQLGNVQPLSCGRACPLVRLWGPAPPGSRMGHNQGRELLNKPAGPRVPAGSKGTGLGEPSWPP